MSVQMHTFRRGATYTWRKRVPARLGGGVFQISLRTNEPLIARRLAMIISAESCVVMDDMASRGLSKDDARKLLVAVIEREHERIRGIRIAASEDTDPLSHQRNTQMDWAMGQALALLGQRGASAANITDADKNAFRSAGKTDADIRTVETNIRLELPAFTQEPNAGLNARPFKVMKAALGRETFSPMELLEGRLIYYRGRGAAFLASDREEIELKEADDLAANSLNAYHLLAHAPAAPDQTKETEQDHMFEQVSGHEASEEEVVDQEYDPDIHALIARMMEQKRKKAMKDDMIVQMTRVLELFVEAVGVQDIRKLQQRHAAKFVDILQYVPKNYRKSPKDKGKTIQQIIADAPEDYEGLSVTTINRNLDYLGQLLRKARSEGFLSVAAIDLTCLRVHKISRDRDKRKPFTQQDIQAIFQHPVWTGFRNLKKWHEPGDRIEKDGLYWIPLIAAYSGARRAELAGLMVCDFETIDGIPCMRIRDNRNRSVKTFASERDVPLHPHLIDLGLMSHIEMQRKLHGSHADAFPDQKPGKAAKWGDKIDYRFRELVTQQIKNDRENKVFHSFRHHLTTELAKLKVPKEVRQDLVGHVGEDVTDERYTDTATPEVKLAALMRLPRIQL